MGACLQKLCGRGDGGITREEAAARWQPPVVIALAMHVATFALQYRIGHTTSKNLLQQAGRKGEFVAFKRQRPRPKLAERERRGQVVASVECANIRYEPSVRMFSRRGAGSDIFVE